MSKGTLSRLTKASLAACRMSSLLLHLCFPQAVLKLETVLLPLSCHCHSILLLMRRFLRPVGVMSTGHPRVGWIKRAGNARIGTLAAAPTRCFVRKLSTGNGSISQYDRPSPGCSRSHFCDTKSHPDVLLSLAREAACYVIYSTRFHMSLVYHGPMHLLQGCTRPRRTCRRRRTSTPSLP